MNLTYIVMDNFVYGLTKKQTSPTSPRASSRKTDPAGAIDQPINDEEARLRRRLLRRPHPCGQVKHMMEVFERAILHPGFSVVEVLSECVIFYPGAFDEGNQRKGGAFDVIEEKKWDQSDEDAGATISRTKTPPTSLPRSLPRKIRRLLRDRSSDEEPTRAAVDRFDPREGWIRHRRRTCSRAGLPR